MCFDLFLKLHIKKFYTCIQIRICTLTHMYIHTYVSINVRNVVYVHISYKHVSITEICAYYTPIALQALAGFIDDSKHIL